MPPAKAEKGVANAVITARRIILFVVNCIYKLPFEKLTQGSLLVICYYIATEMRRYCYVRSMTPFRQEISLAWLAVLI